MATSCDKLRIGHEFLSAHDWPMTLRKSAFDRCYCEICYLRSYEDTLEVAGYSYVIPREWTRFGVYVDEPFAKHHQVWNKWANCFHGTSIENAKSIVEHRQLLLPRDVTLDGKKLQIREGHIPGEYFFFTTPTIRYAALDVYTYTYDFKSSIDNNTYKIKVALQCKQKPDSFVIQPETVGATERGEKICPHIQNSRMEWKTQHRSSIMPYGLMLHITTCEGDKRRSAIKNIDSRQQSRGVSAAVSKKTQSITCPHCSKENIWENGNYIEGKSVTCCYDKCKKKFVQLACPHCAKSNFWKNADYREGKPVTCCYENCRKKFIQLSCPHCSQSNVWKNADYYEGKTVNCCYDSCRKKFIQLSCPHCSQSNVWKNADYREGATVRCSYENCKKAFIQLSCPHCSQSNVWKNADYREGVSVTCWNSSCKKQFQQLSCPHCSQSNIWKNSDYREGKPVTCCYENCKEKFQQLVCPHCSGSNVWKNAVYVDGQTVKCCHEECQKTFQKVSCAYCSRTNVWKNCGFITGQSVTCCYEDCRKTFQK